MSLSLPIPLSAVISLFTPSFMLVSLSILSSGCHCLCPSSVPISVHLSLSACHYFFFFFTVVTVCPFLCVCFSDYRLIRVDSSVCLTPLSVNPLSLSLTLRLSTLCPGQFLRLQFYSCPPLCVSPHHPLHPLYDCQSSPTVIPSGIACWQSAGLVIERLRVRIPAGTAAEFSSPS